MKLNLDLEQKPMQASAIGKPGKYYPSFSFETEEEHDIPASGVMTIRYKKTSSSEDKRGDKTRYRCSVDVQEIVSTGKGGGENDDEEQTESDDNAAEETQEAESAPPAKSKKKSAPRSAAARAVLGDESEAAPEEEGA